MTARQSCDRPIPYATMCTALRLLLLSVGFGSVCLSPVSVMTQAEDSQKFRPRRLLPPRPPITDPPILSGQDPGVQLADNELVLGVVVNKKPRAYPINMLTGPTREIINDMLGDVPIAATWCHLCHNTVVYDRRVDEQTLTFAVSGKLWKHNLVMIDSETSSLWSHFLGKAMDGSMQGKKLQAIPSKLTTWGDWRREHQETTVLAMPRRIRQYVEEYYDKPEDFVFGFVINGHAHHASFAMLQNNPVLNLQLQDIDLLVTFDPRCTGAQVFERSLDGKTLAFTSTANRRMKDDQTDTVWDRDSGIAVEGSLKGKSLKQRVGMPAFATAWKAFHPESQKVQLSKAATNQ